MIPNAILEIAGYPVLYLYDLCLALGVLAALFLGDKLAIKSGFSVALQKTLIFSTVAAVVLGYGSAVVFQGFYNFLESGKFTLNADTGATFYGGLIGGAGVFLLVWFIAGGKEAREKFSVIADIASVCIPLAHAIGRIGCFFAGCCHGKPVSGFFGVYMEVAGEEVLPVQLYECAFLLLLSAVLFLAFQKKKSPLMPVYLIAYGVWRFLIEYARGDMRGQSPVAFLSPSQFTAILLVAVGIGYFIFAKIKKAKKPPFGR